MGKTNLMSYPQNCLRGIPNDDFIDKEGNVLSHLFYFKSRHLRSDGWIAQSINWEDDESARQFTLNQKNQEGEIQFKIGVAVIERILLDAISDLPTVNHNLTYEKNPLDGNRYHGNLLLKSNVSKAVGKQIAAGIALAVSEVISQSNTSS